MRTRTREERRRPELEPQAEAGESQRSDLGRYSVLQGGFFHGVHSLTFGVDLMKIRLMGILQRIAIAYLLAAICEIWLKGDDDVDSGYGLLRRYRYQLFVGLVLSIAIAIERTSPTNLARQQRTISHKYEIPVPGQLFKFYSS
ncbi:hypothetical protein BDA96_04G213500 [Sorghum bicolor]|uniref:Uncharacterized protein n=1 Tax=Sorghum bicolor TaxID=4558 RepID=A0A921R5P3_SORBI|nr:hypothetical protein BDA96_04G213500 [Sorghum bicolor]